MISLPAGVSVQDLIAAQQAIIKRSPIVSINTPTPRQIRHECTPVCVFHEHGCVKVCTHSNNVHFCSAALCQHLFDCEDSQVCAITNSCYPLAFVIPAQYDCAKRVHSHTQGGAEADQPKSKRGRVSANAKNEAEAHNVLKHMLGSIRVMVEPAGPGGRKRGPGAEPPPPPSALSTLTSSQSDTTTSSISSQFPSSTASAAGSTLSTATLFDVSPIEDLLDLGRRLWYKCTATTTYRKQPFRYRHKYHVLVVLYACIKGLKTGDRVGIDIPCYAYIRRYLPPFKRMHAVAKAHSYDVSTFTQTNKIFLLCMREIADGR